VVDDDPAVVRGLVRMLRADHDVETVPSAREALTLLSGKADFTLILCDLMMPEFSGADLHRALRAKKPELAERMIFLTGGAFTPECAQFLETVTNPVLHKPFDAKSLREAIATRAPDRDP
jgi:CheY-like chemotaxis protein